MIITPLPVGRNGDDIIAVVLDEEKITVGDVVDLVVRKKPEGTYIVKKVVTRRLIDVQSEDLKGTLFPNTAVFWQRVESATGTGQPGEKLVNFVTLATSWEDESIETLDKLDQEKDEQFLNRTRKRGKED
jgi:hypothetical protein